MWVYLLGTAAEAKSFHYNITIFTDGGKENGFSAPVSSIDLTGKFQAFWNGNKKQSIENLFFFWLSHHK